MFWGTVPPYHRTQGTVTGTYLTTKCTICLLVSTVGGELVPGDELIPLGGQADVPRHEVQAHLSRTNNLGTVRYISWPNTDGTGRIRTFFFGSGYFLTDPVWNLVGTKSG